MWNVDPKVMCNKHLFGEHVEMHMFAGTIKKNKSIQGYLDNQLVEVHNIKKRHDELVKEIKKRGFNHKSPIIQPKFGVLRGSKAGFVDIQDNMLELRKRCPECRNLQRKQLL